MKISSWYVNHVKQFVVDNSKESQEELYWYCAEVLEDGLRDAKLRIQNNLDLLESLYDYALGYAVYYSNGRPGGYKEEIQIAEKKGAFIKAYNAKFFSILAEQRQ